MQLSASIAPLRVANDIFAIDLKIEHSPLYMIEREHIINAMETSVLANEEVRKIIIFGRNGKLGIINSGQGMPPETLVKATDFNFSTKVMGTTGNNHRGEGAKVVTLGFSQLGVRYRSRHNGEINEVLLCRDENTKQYGRHLYDYEDDAVQEFAEISSECDYEDSSKNPFHYTTKEDEALYNEFKSDFTEVLIYGNSEDQDTVLDLYGENATTQSKEQIAHRIFARFYRAPTLIRPDGKKIPCSILFDAPTFRKMGDQPYREMTLVGDLVTKYPKRFTHLDERFIEIAAGITVEFLHCPLDSKKRGAFNMVSMGRDSGHAAIVYEDEMYGTVSGRTWSDEVLNYGLFGLHRSMSVFVHLDPKIVSVTPDAYRLGLSVNGKIIALKDFASLIYNARPRWVIDLVEAAHGRTNTGRDAKAKLQKFAVQLHEKRFGIVKNKNKPDSTLDMFMNGKATTGGGGGTTQGGGTARGLNSDDPTLRGSPGGTTGRKRQQSVSDKDVSNKAGVKNFGVPEITWLRGSAVTDINKLVNRGAVYNGVNVPELFLNADYAMMSDMLKETRELHFGANEYSRCIDLIRAEFEKNVAYKVGRAVLLALKKKNTLGWSLANVEEALKPEALSICYDSCVEDITKMVQNIKASGEYRKRQNTSVEKRELEDA